MLATGSTFRPEHAPAAVRLLPHATPASATEPTRRRAPALDPVAVPWDRVALVAAGVGVLAAFTRSWQLAAAAAVLALAAGLSVLASTAVAEHGPWLRVGSRRIRWKRVADVRLTWGGRRVAIDLVDGGTVVVPMTYGRVAARRMRRRVVAWLFATWPGDPKVGALLAGPDPITRVSAKRP